MRRTSLGLLLAVMLAIGLPGGLLAQTGIHGHIYPSAIDLSGPLTMTSGAGAFLLGAGGTPSAPSLAWSTDTDTGFARVNANEIQAVTGGTTRWTLNSTGLGVGDSTPAYLLTVGSGDLFGVNSSGLVLAPDGTAAAPAYAFTGALNVGIGHSGGALLLGTAGNWRTQINASGQFLFQLGGTAAAPSMAWTTDSDTGLYRDTANTIGFATGGIKRASLDSAGFDAVNDVKINGTSVIDAIVGSEGLNATKTGNSVEITPTYGTGSNNVAMGNKTLTLANGNGSFTFGGNGAAIGANRTIDITPTFGSASANIAQGNNTITYNAGNAAISFSGSPTTIGVAASNITASVVVAASGGVKVGAGGLQLDPAIAEAGTVNVAEGATTATITFGTSKGDTNYSIVPALSETTTSTKHFWIDTKTATDCVLNLGEAVGDTLTFDWICLHR